MTRRRINSDLLRRANALYRELPVYLQYAVDEDPESGLEPEELPDAYRRMGFKDEDDER